MKGLHMPRYDTPRLVTVDDAADRLGVSRSTVYRLLDAGTLRRVKLGHSVRIRLDDIDHLIETATVDPDRDALPRWV
jgi:excisionase family DNA binding protein